MAKRIRRVVFDGGNDKLKITNGRDEICVPHALIEIPEAKWNQIMIRSGGNPPVDYVKVNGKAYAIGEQAEKEGVPARRSGASKFDKNYIGVMMAALMGRLWITDGDMVVFASYAPGVVNHRDDLMDALSDNWRVECGGHSMVFRVRYVNTFEEPVGGFMNVLLKEDGMHYANPKIAEGSTLTFDIGGGTTDMSRVFPNGELDYSLQLSLDLGINDVYAHLEDNLRNNHPKFFRDIANIPPARIREALQTGQYTAKGKSLDCIEDVKAAKNILLNGVASGFRTKARGGADDDNIVLTGGGPVDIRADLLDIFGFNPEHVIDAEEPQYMHLANVRGGMKMLRMYEGVGAIEYPVDLATDEQA